MLRLSAGAEYKGSGGASGARDSAMSRLRRSGRNTVNGENQITVCHHKLTGRGFYSEHSSHTTVITQSQLLGRRLHFIRYSPVQQPFLLLLPGRVL